MGLSPKLPSGLAGLAFLIAGCGGGAPETVGSPTAESPTQTQAPLYQAEYQLIVGDCLDPILDSDDNVLLAGEMRACDEPHLMEVLGTPVLDGALGETYPGDDEVSRQAEGACLSDFEEYVGVDFDNSRLDVTYYAPSSESWAGGDRRVICVIEAIPAAPLTQSVQGSEQ